MKCLSVVLLGLLFVAHTRAAAIPDSADETEECKTTLALRVLNHAAPRVGENPSVGFEHLVRFWRRGKLDWHLMMKPHIPPQEECGNTRRFQKMLRMREEDRIARALNEWTPAVEANRSVDAYRWCALVSQPCMLYKARDVCSKDALCSWCEADQVCLPTNARNIVGLTVHPSCAPPAHSHVQETTLAPGGIVRTSDGHSHIQNNLDHCSVVLTNPVYFLTHRPGTEEMYYHWHTEVFEPLHNSLTAMEAGARALQGRNLQLILMHNLNSLFFGYFGLLTDLCPRYLGDLANNTCYTQVLSSSTFYDRSRARKVVPYHTFIRRSVLPDSLLAPPTKPRVAFISRRVKRFILNEAEIAQHIRDTYNMDVVRWVITDILPLEDMTLSAQLAALAPITLLIGVHGSGLVNALFLPAGASVIQVMPYKVGQGASFFERFAASAGVKYYEWTNKNISNTVPHAHMLPAKTLAKFPNVFDYALQFPQLATPGSTNDFFTFWINQDTIISWPSFKLVLDRTLCHGIHKALNLCPSLES